MEDIVPLEMRWYVALVAAVIVIFLLFRLARGLPPQNLLLIVPVIMGAQALLEFYLLKFEDVLLVDSLPLYLTAAGLLWLTVILLCRRGARMILRPWTRRRGYGFWLIILASVGVGCFQYCWASCSPFLIPEDTGFKLSLFRGFSAAVLLTILFPWFVRKRPSHSKSGKSEAPVIPPPAAPPAPPDAPA